VADPEIHEESIDGVRTLWVEGPAPFRALLGFRVGWGDETLRSHGLTHLVEHLALSRVGSVSHFYNGGVGLNQTHLMAAGTTEQVGAFLEVGCTALANLPLERLETEIGVLQAEDAPRRASAHAQILADLFGFAGAGVNSMAEYALAWVGDTDVTAWAESHFTTGNAVLALTGPPPPGLRLPLARGSWRPPEMPLLQPDVPNRRSRRRRTSDEFAAVGALGRRSAALVLAGDILRERLLRRLRTDLGLVYQVDADYSPLDADHAFVYAGTAAESRHARRVSADMLDALDALTRQGPDAAEVEQARSRLLAWTEEPEELRCASVLWMRASQALFGDPPSTLESLRAEYAAAGPHEVREALAAAMEQVLVAVAPGVRGFEDPLIRSDAPIRGRRFERKGAVPRLLSRVKAPPPGASALIIGDQGAAMEKEGRWVTLSRADIAVTEWRPGPVVLLFGTSGRWLRIDTREWNDPDGVRRALDRMVPEETDIPARRGDRRSWRPAG
jgi:hypothetical protein